MVSEKADPKNTGVGIAWYRREQWPRLLEISTDRSDLEDSYDHWLMHITEAFETMRNEGLDPVKVDVDTEELLAWCRTRNLPSAQRRAPSTSLRRYRKTPSHPRMIRMIGI